MADQQPQEGRAKPGGPPAAGSAVLFSGGLDSAVLLAAERRDHAIVWPVHVRSGLAWEDAEARVIVGLLAAAPFAGQVQPLNEPVGVKTPRPPSADSQRALSARRRPKPHSAAPIPSSSAVDGSGTATVFSPVA